MLNLFMKRNYHKNQFFAILSFCEIYVFFPHYYSHIINILFRAYIVYGIIASGFIQPVTVHWAWSNGWLLYPPESLKLPPAVWYRDYAGGGNVHAVGGIAALVSCIFIGPRLGRFSPKTGQKIHIPGDFEFVKSRKSIIKF